MEKERTYVSIDLKSFYASAECMDHDFDPLDTNLVVADESRTDKTICLAVSPSLKAYGIPGRCRLFEVRQKVKEVNAERLLKAPGRRFTGKSIFASELAAHPELELDFFAAVPRMAHYIQHSTRIYNIYLRYIAPEDIHVYSIDEVMMDVTAYLNTYGMTARELAGKMIHEVLNETGVTATAGIGSNLYLSKVAMDIVAKHTEPDADGVRIAELDEMSYRKLLWNHRPLTDFWRIGHGIARKLEARGIYTMGDVARCSLQDEDLLFKLFGINAELLIDHAWGWEPVTMELVKSFTPENNSACAAQVLSAPADLKRTRVLVLEMAEEAALGLVEKKAVTDQMVLGLYFDRESLDDPDVRKAYAGKTQADRYGRQVPKPASGTANLGRLTSSGKIITEAVMKLFDEIMDPRLLVRRISLGTNHLIPEEKAEEQRKNTFEQMDLFTDYDALEKEKQLEKEKLEKERKLQEAMLAIKKRFGSTAVLKGVNMEEGATGIERSGQIGGHRK